VNQTAQQRTARLQNPGPPDKVFERHPFQLRKRMIAPADEAEFLVADLLVHEG